MPQDCRKVSPAFGGGETVSIGINCDRNMSNARIRRIAIMLRSLTPFVFIFHISQNI